MGHEKSANNPKLRDDISTDEITPAHICFYLRRDSRRHSLTGTEMRQRVAHSAWGRKEGRLCCAVSGKRRGKGSSREQSPYAELCAGIQFVIAENIERIYKQNCQNLGVLTSTDFSLIDKIRTARKSPCQNSPQAKMRSRGRSSSTAGCFHFNVARMQRKVLLPAIETRTKSAPMTLAEKSSLAT